MSREGEVYRQPGALAGQIVRQADAFDQAFSRTWEKAPGCSDDYDPEGVLIGSTSDGGVMLHLPEITRLDVEPWAVDLGLTHDRLVQLRDAIDRHLRGAAGNAGPASRVDVDTVATVSLTDATGNCGDSPTVATPSDGVANASRSDIDTTGSDRVTPGHSVVGLQPTTVGQQPTVVTTVQVPANDSPSTGRSVASQTEATATETVTVAQQATVAREVERLRGVVARCQGLADWLTRHSSLGVDIEADGIRRAIGDRLRTALDPSARPAEWEAQ